MADDSPRDGGLGGVTRWFMAALAAACLMCALAIAAYAGLRADTPYCSSEACRSASAAGVVLLWAVAAATVLIGVLAGWHWWSRMRTGQAMPRKARMAAAISAVGLVAGYIAIGMASTSFAASGQRIWMVRVAVGLVVTGCVAVAACQPPARSDAGRLAAALAGVVAVVLVAGVASVAWRDARSTLDATTAAAVEMPAAPAKLGQERFRLSLPYYRPQIEVAGAGFVVWTPYWSKGDAAPDLMAFGASGSPRWHYSRTGPGEQIARLGVYDAGRVLVVGVVTGDSSDGGGREGQGTEIVGLDAVTGEQLWTSTDREMWNALDINEGGSHLSFAVRGEDFWTGFDARTGQQTWRIPNPASCDENPLKTLSNLDEPYVVRPADTDTHLVTVVDCSTPERISLRVLVNEPATGEQVVDRPIPQADGQPRDTWELLSVDGGFDDGVPITLTKECAEWAPSGPCTTPGEQKHVLFNYLTGTSIDLPPGWVYPSYQPRGDFIVVSEVDDGTVDSREIKVDTVDLMNADMTPRCQYTRQRWAGGGPRWLTAQLIDEELAPEGGGIRVRAVDRETCRDEAVVAWPIPSGKDVGMRYTVPARGATLLVQTNDDSTVDIVGYAP